MSNLKPSVSVVIPVYNSAEILPSLLERLTACLPGISRAYEIILINDGSRDGSWSVISDLARRLPMVRGLCLMRNYGQHNALLCGIRAARYDVIVTMDDDLQHPPEEIVRLLEKLAEGHNVVYGYPAKETHGLWRDLASQMTKLALQSAMGVDLARRAGAFRAFRTDLRAAFCDYGSPYVNLDVLLTWASTRFAAVPVQHNPRASGVSNYTFGKLVTHALNMITGYSTAPLRFASLLGFAFTAFGILVLVYVVGRYLILGTSVPGFPFLASAIAIFSGAQLLCLGIMGEYLARMHLRTMERPTYAVREDTSAAGKTGLTLPVDLGVEP